jgi:hypothetical protein
MVHALLALTFLFLAGWGFGMIGFLNQHIAWTLMVAGWFTFMAWCYAFYMQGAHHRGDWRDRHGHRFA